MADASDKSRDTGKLDLGLAELLSSATAAEVADIPAPQEGVSNSGQLASDGEQAGTRELSVFERLAAERRWRDLVTEAERALSDGQQVEPRLWWIRAQLEGESMPASFLAAPFEAVCGRLGDHPLSDDIRRVLVPTGDLLLKRLEQAGDSEHRASLEALVTRLGIASRTEVTGAAPRSDTGTSRQEVRVGSGTPRAEEAKLLVAPPSWGGRPDTFPPIGGERVQRGRRLSLFLLGAAAFVALLALSLFWFGKKSVPGIFGASEVWLAPEHFVEQAHAPELVIPAALRRDPVGSLGALYYYIDEPVPTAVSIAPAVVTPPQSPEPAAVSQKPKETVNTKGPLEGPEFTERRQRYENGPPVLQQPKRSGERGPVADAPPSRRPDGRMYSVIVRTVVLSEPSYEGLVISELMPGARVFVEARLGRWMRIRSSRGRSGFVLAQDLKEPATR